jgi:Serine hydrolase (FSH1)
MYVRVLVFLLMFSLSRGYRVLVLHGKYNSADNYRRILSPLVDCNLFQGCEFKFLNAPHRIGDESEYEWWGLAKEERSYTAKEYIGIDKSINLIESVGEVDAIIGHSQGAILTSILLARGVLGKSKFLPKKAILSGAAWPNPYTKMLENLQPYMIESAGLKTLHVVGDADDVNPTEHARLICDIFRGDLMTHPGGHFLPTDEASLKRYAEFLQPPVA